MKVLYVASEALPFAASGGLADVAGSLPKAMRNRLVGCLLQDRDQLLGQLIIRTEGVSDTALPRDGLKPNASIQILAAADIAVVGVISNTTVDTLSSAKCVISRLPDQVPGFSGIHSL